MITFRRGHFEDINELIRLRIEFLSEMGNIKEQNEVQELRLAIREYFEQEINKGFFCWIAEENEMIVGTSGLVFYKKPPLNGNLNGIDGYIMNMYTVPGYRRKGIARSLLDEVLRFLRDNNIHCVSLHATEDGKNCMRV